MSRSAEREIIADPVLLRLPGAAWRALAPLGIIGALALCVWALASWLFGPMSPLTPVAVAPAAVLAMAWGTPRVQQEIFDLPAASAYRCIQLASLVTLPTALLLGWSLLTARMAVATGSLFLQVMALGGVLSAVVLALVAVVLLPVGVMRAEVSIRTLITVSAVAALRRPFGPLATLVVPMAIAWLGLTWFGGLLLLVAPLAVVLSIAAGWSSATAVRVSLPPLMSTSPTRRLIRGEA